MSRVRERLEAITGSLARSLLLDDATTSRFDRLVAEWLRRPLEYTGSGVSPAAPAPIKLESSSDSDVSTWRLVDVDELRRNERDEHSTKRQKLAASVELSRDILRQQDRRREVTAPRRLADARHSLVDAFAAIFRVFLLEPFSIVIHVGSNCKQPSRFFLFGDTGPLEHVLIVDNLLSAEEHRALHYMAALAPVTCRRITSSTMHWSDAQNSAFSRAIDRVALLERVARSMLRGASARQYGRYVELVDAALLALYERSMRAGYSATAIPELASTLRRLDREDARRVRRRQSDD